MGFCNYYHPSIWTVYRKPWQTILGLSYLSIVHTSQALTINALLGLCHRSIQLGCGKETQDSTLKYSKDRQLA